MAFPRCAAVVALIEVKDADCGAAHVQPGIGRCRLSHYLFQSRPFKNRRMHSYWGDSLVAGCAPEQERRTDRHKIRAMAYVLHAMQMLGLGKWVSGPLASRL